MVEVGSWNTIRVRGNSLSTLTEEKMEITYAGITFLGPDREQGGLGYRKSWRQNMGVIKWQVEF